MPTIADRERLINNCAVMLRLADALGLPYVVTEQYPQGLGRTVAGVAAAMSNPLTKIEKTRFSGVVEAVEQRLRTWRRPNVLVCGIEAHVCVLQTVLDVLESGRQAFVVSDAVSASQPAQIAPSLDRMTRAGAVVTGVMSAMYELLADSTHPAFRQCLELAKSVKA